MQHYTIPLVPGPVSIPADILALYQQDYGSADLEGEFLELYRSCEQGLQQLLVTTNRVVIQSGEGMLALWGALKSVLQPGDRVLAVATGLFGYGIGEMAAQLGAEVETVGFGYNDIADPQQVREVAQRFRPRLITAVHCETPSGTLNPLTELGAISREVDALFYVDFVASAGGSPVLVDSNQIDLGLLGSQKVLSLLPDLAMVSVSPRAWERIAAVNYVGYDALLPWRTALEDAYFPYTHNWQALAGLQRSLQNIFDEGVDAVYARHATIAAACRQGLQTLGIELWPARASIAAPTVTAAKVPASWEWAVFDQALRAHGLAVGGNYGPLAGQVFRIGHMGTQANLALVEQGLAVIQAVLQKK
ncbi:MAG: aminotransferase class V-fold PLP-dependent enzyme [Caldilineaceae bacterium]